MNPAPTSRLTLFDHLSNLSFHQASKLLGPDGNTLILRGGTYSVDVQERARLTHEVFRLHLFDSTVSISLDDAARDRLRWKCSSCSAPCEHVGAAFSLILEEKMLLGLAEAPKEREPIECLSEDELVARALADREERAREETMRLTSGNPEEIWTDYTVTSASSGKSYRVALRGWERGESYCSCPDFRKNTLGTCKHILYSLERVRRRFPASKRNTPYRRRGISVHLDYGEDLELRLRAPEELDGSVRDIIEPIRGRPITDLTDLLRRIRRLEQEGRSVTIYPDAEAYIRHRLLRQHIASKVEEIRRDPASHPLRTSLLKAELLPYQLDGIAFAAGAGRAVLADDMGLGKTIQGIGLAEFLVREVGIRKVLVIAPASVKAQWRNEIRRFSHRDAHVVLGGADERAAQYGNEALFTICNYEQVVRDISHIERVRWDLIILDEGQRIKNWEAKTTQIIKGLRSPFALVLSGTPLENRLDDLFSIVEFIDERRLGPAFRFFNRHRVTDEKGKVLGYKDLDALRERLRPVLLRRTRSSVMKELPKLTTEIVRVPPTEEQLLIENSQMQIVGQIVSMKYISEMDLLRLRKALLIARMNADSTYLVDKREPGFSTKLDRLAELLDDLAQEEDRKIVLFSEWTTMLDVIENVLERLGLSYVRLDGSVPQKDRQELVRRFGEDAECRLFITTNAGSTGLNLQEADTVVNVDLPWNPAVLEQRIARCHRMGQQKPVQVYVLVTEDTLEEKLLTTLARKHQLALAALDMDSDVDEVSLVSGIEELKRRLEVLLGARPDAAVKESERRSAEAEVERAQRRSSGVAEAGGRLLSATLDFIGEMVPVREETEASAEMARQFRARLDECLERDDAGRPRLSVPLPDEAALDRLASSLASLLARGLPAGGDGSIGEPRVPERT